MIRGCTICVPSVDEEAIQQHLHETGVDRGGKKPCFDTRFCMDKCVAKSS